MKHCRMLVSSMGLLRKVQLGHYYYVGLKESLLLCRIQTGVLSLCGAPFDHLLALLVYGALLTHDCKKWSGLDRKEKWRDNNTNQQR